MKECKPSVRVRKAEMAVEGMPWDSGVRRGREGGIGRLLGGIKDKGMVSQVGVYFKETHTCGIKIWHNIHDQVR
jgi:hypothetical protein